MILITSSLLLLAAVALFLFVKKFSGKAQPVRTVELTGKAATVAVPVTGMPVRASALVPSGRVSRPISPALARFTMIDAGDLTHQNSTRLRVAAAGAAAPPRVMGELLSPQLLADGNIAELAEVIGSEPMLAAKVVATVNTPFFGLRSPIFSVTHAINFLGRNVVRNIALQMLGGESFKTSDPELQKIHKGIRDAGMIGSDLCFRLAQSLRLPEPGALSTQTLLSFFGDFAISTMLPVEDVRANWAAGMLARTQAEQRALGINANVIGTLTMQEWELPASVIEAVQDVDRILVTPPEHLPKDRASRAALCYASARIGEMAAFGDLSGLSDFDFSAQECADYHFLNLYLEAPALANFYDALRSPGVRSPVEALMHANVSQV